MQPEFLQNIAHLGVDGITDSERNDIEEYRRVRSDTDVNLDLNFNPQLNKANLGVAVAVQQNFAILTVEKPYVDQEREKDQRKVIKMQEKNAKDRGNCLMQ